MAGFKRKHNRKSSIEGGEFRPFHKTILKFFVDYVERDSFHSPLKKFQNGFMKLSELPTFYTTLYYYGPKIMSLKNLGVILWFG